MLGRTDELGSFFFSSKYSVWYMPHFLSFVCKSIFIVYTRVYLMPSEMKIDCFVALVNISRTGLDNRQRERRRDKVGDKESER